MKLPAGYGAVTAKIYAKPAWLYAAEMPALRGGDDASESVLDGLHPDRPAGRVTSTK
jgi:hypothetical protein